MKGHSLAVLAVVALGCGRPSLRSDTQKLGHPIDPWVLTCYDPADTEPALLWNGRIGVRLGRDGGAFDGSHRRLPMFVMDAYQTGGEEKIKRFECPLLAAPSLKGLAPNPLQGSDYEQLLDMRTGVLSTSWKQTAPDGSEVNVAHLVVLHPSKSRIAERWSFQRAGATPNVYEGLYDVNSKGDFQTGVGKFDDVVRDSKRTWDERWETDIEIDGPVADQLAVRSFLFYLRSALSPNTNMSVSPFGLSSDQYFGHVFWDADMWAFPALALIDPNEAAAIPRYRVQKMPRAAKNFAAWASAGRPTATGKLGPSSGPGLMYPWESSVSGVETVPGPSQFEHHITGSVAFSLAGAASLGEVDPKIVQEVIDGADEFYRARSQPGPQGREIRGVMSPDENHVGNNDLYTNLLAEWLFNGGKFHGDEHTEYKLSKDSKSLLTYDDDPERGYKQAAAVLSVYPLQYPPAEKQAKTMMARFASKVSKNGPAMTESVNAIVWARAGEAERAYAAWQNSWRPFTSDPLMLFAEKRSKPGAYFITGAAGSLQSVLYGFLGFRLDSKDRTPRQYWSTKLLDGRVLGVSPTLPKAWRSVKLKNFTVLGRRYSLTVTGNPSGARVRVTPGE